MSIVLLNNQYWKYGQDPDIRFTFSYDEQRSGLNMQYKFYWVFHSLNRPDSGFGWPIYTTVTLDGASKLSGVTIKGTAPMKWFDSKTVVYTSDWLTVPNKLDGTTRWTMMLFSGMGMTRTQSWSGTLSVLPAATIPTASPIEFGQPFTVSLSPAVDTYLHDLTVSMDEDHILTESQVATEAEFTLPMTWLNSFTSGASAPITITCATYDGDEQIGADVVRVFPAAVPDFVKPTINVSVDAVGGFNGQYLSNRSRCRVQTTVTNSYSATTESITVQIGDQNGSGADFTSSTFSDGEYTVTVTVTDSRGRQSVYTGSITVLLYTPITIAGQQMFRCLSTGVPSESGTYAYVDVVSSYSSWITGNSVVITTSYAKRPSGSYSSADSFNADEYAGPACAGQILLSGSYFVRVTATDSVGSSASFTGTIMSSANFGLTINGSKAAFGRYVDLQKTDGLQVDDDLHVGGSADFGIPLPVSSGGTGASTAAGARANLETDLHCTQLINASLGNSGIAEASVAGYSAVLVIHCPSQYTTRADLGWGCDLWPVSALASKIYGSWYYGGFGPYSYGIVVEDGNVKISREGSAACTYRVYGLR